MFAPGGTPLFVTREEYQGAFARSNGAPRHGPSGKRTRLCLNRGSRHAAEVLKSPGPQASTPMSGRAEPRAHSSSRYAPARRRGRKTGCSIPAPPSTEPPEVFRLRSLLGPGIAPEPPAWV